MNIRRFGVAAALLVLMSAPVLAAGAIAVDDEQGTAARDVGYGIGWGETREAAASAAMKECRGAGNSNCKVAVRFDVCGAYVGNRTNYGVGWGDSEEIATRRAMEQCGSKSCKVVVAECE